MSAPTLMQCPQCRAMIVATKTLCPECGKDLRATLETPKPASPLAGLSMAATIVGVGAVFFVGKMLFGHPAPVQKPDRPAAVAQPIQPAVEPVPVPPQPSSGASISPTVPGSRVDYSTLTPTEKTARLLVNESGHLCAKPINVTLAFGQTYRMTCLTNRDGSGISSYLIDSDTGVVTLE